MDSGTAGCESHVATILALGRAELGVKTRAAVKRLAHLVRFYMSR